MKVGLNEFSFWMRYGMMNGQVSGARAQDRLVNIRMVRVWKDTDREQSVPSVKEDVVRKEDAACHRRICGRP